MAAAACWSAARRASVGLVPSECPLGRTVVIMDVRAAMTVSANASGHKSPEATVTVSTAAIRGRTTLRRRRQGASDEGFHKYTTYLRKPGPHPSEFDSQLAHPTEQRDQGLKGVR
jgi:hypothetical protein